MTLLSSISLRVQSQELDELGHVNNARFLEYLERGRMDWYNRCDAALNKAAEQYLGTVIVNIDINYRRECFCDALLSVVTKPYTRGRTSYVLLQEIYDHENQCVCDAKVTSVVMDMNTRKTVSMPNSLARQFTAKKNGEIS
jgi:thioesterase-3